MPAQGWTLVSPGGRPKARYPYDDAVRTAMGRLEPDCLLLDSRGPADYGDSWLDAASAHARERAYARIATLELEGSFYRTDIAAAAAEKQV